MPSRRALALLTLAAVAGTAALSACSSDSYRDTSAPMETAGTVDLERYMGLWYEIARFPNSFEEGCEGVTAQYFLNEDGTVKVVNTCRAGAPDGEASSGEAVAESVSPGNDKLKVDFVPWLPFTAGDYWILHVNEDYTLAVVGEPSGSTGWILAREPVISAEMRAEGEAVLARAGYDVAKLRNTAQPPG